MAERKPTSGGDPVKARWVAAFTAQLPDGRVLSPGDLVEGVPRHEAEASAHWEYPVSTGKPKPRSKDEKDPEHVAGAES